MNAIEKLKSLYYLIVFSFKKLYLCIKKYIEVFLSIKKSKAVLKNNHSADKSLEPLNEIRPDIGKMPLVNDFVFQDISFNLSIIIPMYNASIYIRECLNSIIQQKTKYKYEVILVDDGSTDNTLEIISDYLSDKRFFLIKQENHGQAYARNRAIEQSSGKYIMMVDADDILVDGCIEELLNTAITTDSDISEGMVQRFSNELVINQHKKEVVQIHEYTSNPEFVLNSIGYSVAKVYNRKLWTNLRYPEGYIFEDVITKFILRRKAKRVAYLDKVVYGYRYDSNSSSHKLEGMKHLDSVWVYPRIVALCKSENVPFDDVFYLLSLNHITILNYITTLHLPKEVKLSCFAEMQKQLNSIQFCRSKKVPYLFGLLERAVLEGSFEAWQEIAGTVTKYRLLKKWREIN